MTPFEEAVAAGGPLVAAWDYEDDDRQRLVLFKVGEAGWSKLAETDVPEQTQEAMHDQLTDRGVRVGATYAGGGYVWVADERGFGVWNETKQTGSGKVASSVVTEVRVTYDGGKPDRRAVSLVLKSGGTEVVAEEHSMWPSLDITYDNVNLEMEMMWAHYLSLHLALWHLVPLTNDVSPFSIDQEMAIARAGRALAKDVSKLPDIGTFDPPSQTIAPLGRVPEVKIIVAPADDPGARAIELRVTSPSGKTTSTTTIKRGSKAHIAEFLRRVTMPSVALRAINGVLAQQERDERAKH